jgi:FkbM family methyltransferase
MSHKNKNMIKRVINGVFRRIGYTKIDDYQVLQDKANEKWWKSLNVDLVFDIGASDGGFARKIKGLYPNTELHSFEALPNSFERLIQRCGEFKNFYPNNIALSDKEGEIEFFLCEDSTGSSSMLEMTDIHKQAYPHTAKNKSLKVKSITLDDYVIKNQLNTESKTILMKLDVQGAEKIVLNGCENTLKDVNYIFCEINFVETYKGCVLFPELNKMVEDKGFSLVGIENVSISTVDGSYLQADAFYIKS